MLVSQIKRLSFDFEVFGASEAVGKLPTQRGSRGREPAPHELRDWLVTTREIVRNAFSYDSQCAMDGVMSVENAKCIEDLDGECLYPRFNSALRKGIVSEPVVAKISRLTEEAQAKRRTRLKSRQILFCYLRPDEVGSQSIRANE